MPAEHPTCKEHSGLAEQVKIVCAEMRDNTKAVNELCVEIRGIAVENKQTVKDINNLGEKKADKETVKALSKSFGLLQKIFYCTLIAGIFVGIFFFGGW